MNLKAIDLSMAYRHQSVLSKVNIDFPPGLTALVGPNAAGKSTLLRCLAGHQRFDGEVKIDDQSLEVLPFHQRTQKVRYMPQDFSASAAITVYEALLLGRLSNLGLNIAQTDLSEVNSLLNTFDLTSLSDRYLNELSGGQAQRVAIAQAFASPAKSILLDEPTSNLDLRIQLEVLLCVSRLTRQRHLTTVAALHDLNLAVRFADQICVLKSGRVYAIGEPNQVISANMLQDVYGVIARVEHASDGTPLIWVQGIPTRD